MTLTTLTDAIWSALQRPSPSVTKEEINEIVTAWLGALEVSVSCAAPAKNVELDVTYIDLENLRVRTPEHALIHQYFEGTDR